MVKPGDEIVNPRTGQRMKFIHTSRDTQGELLQIECFNSPGGVKEPEHIHPFQENRFEMLSGCLTFSINGKERQLTAGEAIAIPPNTPHYFWNSDGMEAHYIQEFRPALHSEDFFVALFGLAREGKLNDQGTANLFLMSVFVPSYWDEIRVTKPPYLLQRVLFGLLNPISRMLGYQAT